MIGRPPIYETVEEMQAVVDQYFSDCKRNRIGYAMDPPAPPEDAITDDEFPTVSGLAYTLGMTRRTLIDYGDKDEFSHTVKAAKAKVESILEQRLYFQSPTGVIFNLKNNYGWKDAQDLNHSSPDGSMTPKPTMIELVAPDEQSED